MSGGVGGIEVKQLKSVPHRPSQILSPSYSSEARANRADCGVDHGELPHGWGNGRSPEGELESRL
jgi:hypothetical protein